MSYALSALILIRLDARIGEPVAVSDLAEHLNVQPAVIRAELERLDAAHQVQAVRSPPDGEIVQAIVMRPHPEGAANGQQD